ncbi:41636_t:CDS:2 [Gigaspora margarita]|uniref:41636_t:CDS:1 n=1 Tax=Gigaspora margarita TaxID=4874 RepID=A0ABN7WGB5_GIGMA|nr:41636_t:CDS:2 [Gigaspora margarita]
MNTKQFQQFMEMMAKSFESQNGDKELAEGFIVEMFLSSLKKNNTTFVAIAVPKDLNEAIAIARRVKTGNYYGQHSLEAHKSQQKLLREKKTPKVQNLKTNKTRQEIDLTQNIDPEKIQITDKPKRKCRPEEGNTFNEFDYKEDEEVDEVKCHFIEEYYEESLALFLTNIEEVPVEENKEETNMDEKL